MQMHYGQCDFVPYTDGTRGYLHPPTVFLILLWEEAHTTHHSTVLGETTRAWIAT